MVKINKVQLIHLQKKLGTDEAIGAKLGVTRQAVQQMRKRFGIVSRWASNPQRNKKIRALSKAGKSGAEIARKFGLSKSRVYRVIEMGKRKK
jgi:biotin operon repressor